MVSFVLLVGCFALGKSFPEGLSPDHLQHVRGTYAKTIVLDDDYAGGLTQNVCIDGM